MSARNSAPYSARAEAGSRVRRLVDHRLRHRGIHLARRAAPDQRRFLLSPVPTVGVPQRATAGVGTGCADQHRAGDRRHDRGGSRRGSRGRARRCRPCARRRSRRRAPPRTCSRACDRWLAVPTSIVTALLRSKASAASVLDHRPEDGDVGQQSVDVAHDDAGLPPVGGDHEDAWRALPAAGVGGTAGSTPDRRRSAPSRSSCRRADRRRATPRTAGWPGGPRAPCGADRGRAAPRPSADRRWRRGRRARRPRLSAAEPEAEQVGVLAGAEDVHRRAHPSDHSARWWAGTAG